MSKIKKSHKKSAPKSKPKPEADPAAEKPAAEKFGQLNDNGQPETNGYKLGLQPPRQVEIFYDLRDKSLWHQVNGRYISLAKAELMMFMREMGLRDKIYFDGQRESEWPILQAIKERAVEYAGPLAGYRTGKFKDGSGRMFLVTDEAHGVFGDNRQMSLDEAGFPEFFIAFVQELLPEGQWEFFCHWLAIALRSLAAQDFTPGPVCVLAGEKRCGKSLLQSIITEILGGRAGDPFEYMTGETNHNREFIGAEHWRMEDPRASRVKQERENFGARLKQATVNDSYKIHAKFKDGIDLRVFCRISISVNLEAEYLLVLPPMDDSIADKISLYKCSVVKKTFERLRENNGELKRAKIKEAYMAEIPRIRLWLLKNFRSEQIPPHMRDDRMVLAAYHHPELLEILSSFSHEIRLLELIDECYFNDCEDAPLDINKKSAQIQTDLQAKNAFEVNKITKSPGACGSHLGKLAKSHPDRISKRTVNGTAIWTIKPPAVVETKS